MLHHHSRILGRTRGSSRSKTNQLKILCYLVAGATGNFGVSVLGTVSPAAIILHAFGIEFKPRILLALLKVWFEKSELIDVV
jgi:hypothetical protein